MKRQKQENLYVIRGGEATSYYFCENHICSIEKLQHYTNIFEINDSSKGFKLAELVNLLKRKIDPNAKEINLFINIHGKIKDGEYYFTSYDDGRDTYEIIKASEFVEALIKGTNGVKLNILFDACEGANFTNYIKNLPLGSKVMIPIDADKKSDARDFLHKDIDLMHKVIFKNGFKLEYLLELYCFSQKIKTHHPTVYNITEKGVEMLDLEAMKDSYLKAKIKYSLFIRIMHDYGVFDKSKFDQVYKDLGNTEIKALTPPHNIAATIVNKTVAKELNEYQDILEEYYFAGDLTRLKFGLDDEFKKEIDILIGYRELVKKVSASELDELYDKITKQNEIIQNLTKLLMKEHEYSSPLEFFNIELSNFNNGDTYDKVISKHSIALGLIIDHAINSGEL